MNSDSSPSFRPDAQPRKPSSNADPTHVVWHAPEVTRTMREARLGQRGCVVWFTGLSGCGKSTAANQVDAQLLEQGAHSFVLDGDNVRHGLNAAPEMLREFGEHFAQRFGLTFEADDRSENIRRIAAVAELFSAAGLIALTAFISPFRRDRDLARKLVDPQGEGRFIEVFVDAPLSVCESRDPKGLYRMARAGQIKDFTGLDSPYEPPLRPELTLVADGSIQPANLAQQVIEHLKRQGLLG